MNVWAVTMVRDEADVIEATLRHVAAQGVAGIIVADNGSTDDTLRLVRKVAESVDCTFVIQNDSEPGYWQSRKMTALAEQAHALGAKWIWPFDADEIWYHGDGLLVDEIELQAARNPHHDVIQSRLWHHMPTAVDPEGATPFHRIAYRLADEAPIGKVIVRWEPGAIIHAGNHEATVPGYGNRPLATSIQIRHFPYRSADQFVRKAINGSEAYAATNLPWGTGQHWREYGVHYERGGEEALHAIFREHFFYDLPSASGLVHDPTRLDS